MNLEIREASAAELSGWDTLVRQFPRCRVEHTRAWLESLVASGLGRPLYLVWTVDGEIVGCLPGLLKDAGPFRLFGSPLPGWQTGGMGPLFDPARVTTGQIIGALIPALEERYGVAHVELLTSQLDSAAMAALGFRPEETPTYRAPLYPGDEARQLELLKDSARRNIKRAHKLGLQLRVETDESFVEPHYRQLCDVYVRGGNTISFSLERVREAFRHLRDAGALLAASVWLPDGKTMIASAMFAIEGRELLLWTWAHSTRYRWYRATELLTWSLMTRAMARGCDSFDLMGLGDFKAKFGASLDCSKTRWVRSRTAAITRLRDLAGRAYAWQQKLRGKLKRRAYPREVPPLTVVMSRFDCSKDPDALLQEMQSFGWAQPEPPVLLYDTDDQLLFLSRNRERLGQALRFVVPDAGLVEDLVDTERFQALAQRLKLPVAKAPGTATESYHVYVDAQGRIAGEFTARTIRTGGALETTDAPDVLALGRSVVQRLKLRGVATLEFTRGSDGTLYLLGVHARFGLWHTVGARAGVNIPAFVYADLVGSERPAAPKPRPSVPTAPPAPPAPPVAASRVPQSVEA